VKNNGAPVVGARWLRSAGTVMAMSCMLLHCCSGHVPRWALVHVPEMILLRSCFKLRSTVCSTLHCVSMDISTCPAES
jgi:hypothetical protein